MTGPALGQLALSTSKCLVEIDLASRGCVQQQFGLLRLLFGLEGRFGIDLGLGALLFERCSQIFAM